MDNIVSNNDIDWAKVYDYYETELRHIYNETAQYQNLSHFEMLKSKASSYLNKDLIFCEIGFGSGITLRLTSDLFRTVYGLDISERNVEQTRKELTDDGITNAQLYTSNLMIYEDKYSNSFDVISFIHGLEHFSLSDYPVILENIKRYLRGNGIFTGALPYKLPLNFRMCPHCKKVFELDGHLTSHDLDSLMNVFLKNGFRIIHLSNFNRRFYIQKNGILKFAYKKLKSVINKEILSGQIEFIVQKAENSGK